MKKRNIFLGLILIAVAVCMVGSAMGLIPNIPWFRTLCAILLGAWGIKALFRRDFFVGCFSASIIAWIFEVELGIEELTPFPLVVAAILVGIGLNMIFGKKRRTVSVEYDSEAGTFEAHSIDDVRNQNNKWEDGRTVELTNVFSSVNRYVNSASFSNVNLENVFGTANIYFDNAVMANNTSVAKIENVFGQMNLYLPKTWRVNVKQDAVFGRVNLYGEPNRDMDASFIDMDVETVFGNVNIYFE